MSHSHKRYADEDATTESLLLITKKLDQQGVVQAQHTAAIARLEHGQTQHTAAIARLEHGQTQHTAAIARLEHGQTQHTAAIARLEHGQTQHTAAIAALQGTVSRIEEMLVKLLDGQAVLYQNGMELKRRLDER